MKKFSCLPLFYYFFLDFLLSPLPLLGKWRTFKSQKYICETKLKWFNNKGFIQKVQGLLK